MILNRSCAEPRLRPAARRPSPSGRVLPHAAPWSRALSVAFFDWSYRRVKQVPACATQGPFVVMVDAAHGDSFLIPTGIVGFHDKILVDLPEPTRALAAYRAWCAAGNGPMPTGQRAGFERPLVIGGSDEVASLAPIEMEVESELLHQLWSAKRQLPEGARIDEVRLSDEASPPNVCC